MRSMKKVLWSLLFGMMLLASAPVYGDDFDDEVPDVTARVSRISFIRGNVQIKRQGNPDWEKAVLNLPIVEGDEIMTGPGERLEIQLNIYSHVRLSENSYLKVTGLQDGAVALSLSEGTMNVRLVEFDKDSAFFEVDAPKTTIAIQRAGMYRIDAGTANSTEVRVTATGDGEARVYAENSGMTLKDGRTATVQIDGPYAGEFETADASRFIDEFDTWSLDRDALIAKRLKDAHYDKYYDRDIYGADDLNDHGEWVYTRKYGHVWRPHRSAVSQYANWSPYRYGHWRWVPPYGWTWVNDEPWGWATYHHGRWFYDSGHWYWSPYGYVRRSRSWWSPALVGLTIIRNTICWYPLPHGYGYYNYNYYFGGWGGPRGGGHHGGPRGGGWGGNNGGGSGGNNGGSGGGSGGAGPTPSPTPAGSLPGQVGPSVFTNNDSRRAWFATPPLLRVPPGAVISTPLSSFGRDTTGIVTASPTDARVVLGKSLAQNDPVRILPTYQELDGRVSTAIKLEKPRHTMAAAKKTGAAARNADNGPMDRILQNTKIYGDRDPIRPEPVQPGGVEPRKTGAVVREPVRNVTDETPVRPERGTRNAKPGRVDPVRPEPVYVEPSKPRNNPPDDPVRPEPERKRRDDPVRQPRNDPPPTRSEPVRNDPPPTRGEPTRSEPPKKNDPPPPAKSEPKSEPSKPAFIERKGKDNQR